MRFILAVDGASTMSLQANGEPTVERGAPSRYAVATRVVAGLVRRAKKMVSEPIITLYRSGSIIEKLCDDVPDDSTAVDLLERGSQLGGHSNVEELLQRISTDLQPTFDDHIICLTDACRYEGSDNFVAPCEVRFVVVNTNSEHIDQLQIEELEEISAESCGYDVSSENAEFYHLFYYKTSVAEVVEDISREMLVSPVYKLKMGNLNGLITTSPPLWEGRPFAIEVVGYCKAGDLGNALEVESNHRILPETSNGEGGSDDDVESHARHMVDVVLEGLEGMDSAMTAVCRFGSGKLGIISSAVSGDKRSLNLSLLLSSQALPAISVK